MITRRTFLSALIASPVISQAPAAKPNVLTVDMVHDLADKLKSMPRPKIVYQPLPQWLVDDLKSRQQLIYADLDGIREVKA